MKTIKILLIILLSANLILAQQLTYSPYSRYGLGDLMYQGNVRSLAMGKTSLAQLTKYHINKINPASFAALSPHQVIFEINFFDRISKFQTPKDDQLNNLTNFRSFYGGFPITKWWHSGFGLVPFSTMGYRVEFTDSISASDIGAKYTNENYGFGGINEVFITNSFSYKKLINFGFNLSYVFGSTNRYNQISIEEDYNDFKSYVNFERRSIFQGFKYEFGFIIQDTIWKNSENEPILNIALGGIYSNKQSIRAINTFFVTRNTRFINRTKIDTFLFDTTSIEKILMPQTYGLGISMKFFDKLEISADYIKQNWSGLSYFGQTNFANSQFFAVGLEYCRQATSTRYWRTIRYRLGAYEHQKYLIFNNHQLTERALTFGLGFPFKSFMLNLGFVYGNQGDITTGLKEDFFEFHLNFTIYDIWFMKRKFL